uniref:DUF192 domain-containing protein n=1 Tax=Yoonia sp. TaxID=2212373 RepID=UPI0040486806|tara:strand:+ start:1008 stop:1475 length:468 start_codon:yes stop_codon:yes gene_type:complete
MKSLGFAVVLAFVANGAVAAAVCEENRVTVKGGFGQAGFTVQVADDDETRARGLMNVPEMPTMAGMLFVYDAPQRANFWMRNTLIGLDMLFAGPDGTILSIKENAVPLDETVIDGGPGVAAVLEINGGMSSRLGIKIGDVLQHPAFGPDAILPCE